METKHTRNWTTEKCANGGMIVCLGEKTNWQSQRIQIANEANAKLVASAPELLDALIKATNELKFSLSHQMAVHGFNPEKIKKFLSENKLIIELEQTIKNAVK